MTPPTISEQLLEAASLLLVGMSSVFVFLSVLIVSVKLITKFVEAFPEPAATAHVTPTAASSSFHQQDVITAITHAVSAYRQGKQPPSN